MVHCSPTITATSVMSNLLTKWTRAIGLTNTRSILKNVSRVKGVSRQVCKSPSTATVYSGRPKAINNQQPSIRFTMETERDNKLAFLDTAVLREPDGRLTTSVYRKPTHTDQYLAYDSHHPQSVKRGIVKCLYERAKRLVTKPSVITEEKKHLSSVLVSNGYPF